MSEIQFPIEWGYKIIGKDKDVIMRAIEDIFPANVSLRDKDHHSRNNTYHAIEVSVNVSSKEERDMYFAKLKSHPGINFVL